MQHRAVAGACSVYGRRFRHWHNGTPTTAARVEDAARARRACARCGRVRRGRAGGAGVKVGVGCVTGGRCVRAMAWEGCGGYVASERTHHGNVVITGSPMVLVMNCEGGGGHRARRWGGGITRCGKRVHETSMRITPPHESTNNKYN